MLAKTEAATLAAHRASIVGFRDWIAEARDNGYSPRVHGNGFIQLDANEFQRMHFWGHPAIPQQVVYTPIHNHVFDFSSHVLKGAITNIIYDPVWRADGLFSEWQAQPDPRPGHHSSTLQRTGKRCDLKIKSADTYSVSYFATGLEFHETIIGEPTITLLTKTAPTLQQNPNGPRPSVLCCGMKEPDNTFDRHGFLPSTLWDIIWEIAQ